MSSSPKSVPDDEFILEYYRARARHSTKQAPLSAVQNKATEDVATDAGEAAPRDILTYLALVGPKAADEVRDALQIEPVVFDSALKNLIGLALVQIQGDGAGASVALTDRGRRFATLS